jgi:branched-chain amino acid aminotransferase
VPIKSITSTLYNKTQTYIEGDDAGPVCIKLLSTLKGVQLGKVPDQWGWCDRVQEPANFLRRNESQNGRIHDESVDELP